MQKDAMACKYFISRPFIFRGVQNSAKNVLSSGVEMV
jgi:hypothetical protein